MQTARVFVRESDFGHPRHRLEQMILRHPFNSRLQIIEPFADRNDGMEDIMEKTPCFAIVRFRLAALLSAEFRERWIEDSSAELYGISVGRSADVADVLCLCHKVLRLDVTDETYRSLGLTGRRNTQRKGNRSEHSDVTCAIFFAADRYVIDLKLNSQHFRPGHRHFDRVPTRSPPQNSSNVSSLGQEML